MPSHLNHSEMKFIDQTYRLVQFWDRWRHFVTIGILATFGWSFWFLYTSWQPLAELDANDPLSLVLLNKRSTLLWLFFGFGLGMSFSGLMSYLINAIFGGYRAERLLLKLNLEFDLSQNDQISKAN